MSASPSLTFGARLKLGFAAFFGILRSDEAALRYATLALPAPEPAAPPPAAPPPPPLDESARMLLALLQRDGRLIDFLEQDVMGFEDAEIGAAVRVVHEGCRKALRTHAKIEPVRAEAEGTRVTVQPGFPPAEVKLTGNVTGSGPFTGVVVHRGWRLASLTLPEPAPGHDATILAPAEIEL